MSKRLSSFTVIVSFIAYTAVVHLTYTLNATFTPFEIQKYAEVEKPEQTGTVRRRLLGHF